MAQHLAFSFLSFFLFFFFWNKPLFFFGGGSWAKWTPHIDFNVNQCEWAHSGISVCVCWALKSNMKLIKMDGNTKKPLYKGVPVV